MLLRSGNKHLFEKHLPLFPPPDPLPKFDSGRLDRPYYFYKSGDLA